MNHKCATILVKRFPSVYRAWMQASLSGSGSGSVTLDVQTDNTHIDKLIKHTAV